jgi:hypothetical protein
MSAFLNLWEGTLADDLRSFVDRGTEPRFESDGHTLRANWQVRGQEHEALFELDSSNTLRWVDGPSGDDDYATFLTSDRMADFQRFATACKATIPLEPDFVPSEAVIEDGLRQSSDMLTPKKLSDLTADALLQNKGLTRLFFLKGDAGAGKTTLLREATALQADRYLSGESAFLYFYVPAQGRELSNLRDAFSGELQELRAAFTRDTVATLTRAGVLVPVIDGFDELLGTAGYSGAFSSLQSLLSELDAHGTLVVSARSAFYDLEFLGRSNGHARDADMSISTLELMPWSDEQLREYLLRDRGGQDATKTLAVLDELPNEDHVLLKRPFFASRFETYVSETDGVSERGLLEHLITAYINREADKIVNANGDPVLPPDGHRHFFELAVAEMWESESRQLSVDDLRTISELVSEKFGLDADQASQLRAKVTSYAGFRPRGGRHHSQANFAFEHEVYFDYFLASALGRLLNEGRFEELVRFFDRGVVPESVFASAVSKMPKSGALDPTLLSCATGIAFENRRRNLGGLVLTYAREVSPLSNTPVRGLTFIDISAGPAVFSGVEFVDCRFISTDLCGITFEDCDAPSSNFDRIKLDARSKMEIRGLVPGSNIRSLHDESNGPVYSPEAIAQMLDSLGAPADAEKPEAPKYSKHAQKLIKLLEKTARAYSRSKILYEGDHQHPSLIDSPLWPELRQLLIKHDIISKEMRESRGANVPGYRLRVNVDELLTDQMGKSLPQSGTASLWEELRKS